VTAGRGRAALPAERDERAEVVRAEPFQQIEIVVGPLFGDDPPEP
jgi:hypothetical protein